MRAVLLGDLVCGYLPHLRESLRTEWELVTVMDAAGEDERRRALSGAEAILAVRWTAADQAPSGLRLLQVAAAGYDTIDLATVPPQVPVCNAFGHEPAIGEYAVMAMLAWCHRFLPATRELRDGRWVMTMQERPVHAELAGKQVLVIGTGRIGRAIGERAAALGCHVSGVNRSPRETPAGFAAQHGMDQLDRLLPTADFVAIACALGDETRGLIDRRRLALLRPAAVLVNVARGPIIDEAALYAALRERRIGGAILDVWWQYPTAEDRHAAIATLPFHQLDNVVMTPHFSGWTEGLFRRRSAQMAENLDRLARGQPLINLVRAAAAGI